MLTSSTAVANSRLLSIVLALALGACSSSDNDDMTVVGTVGNEFASALQIGLLLMAYPPESGGSAPLAFFQRLAEPESLAGVVAASNEDLDTCHVERGEENEDEIIDELLGAMPISAGETQTFRSAEGTYYSMQRRDNGAGGYFYQCNSFLTSPLPTDLTLDIPGATFPGFANIALADVTPVQDFTPASRERVTIDIAFTWTLDRGSQTPFNNIVLYLESEADDVSTVTCNVKNDGEFTLPPATKTELGAGFSGRVLASRFSLTSRLQSDALLVVTNQRPAD